MSDILPQPHQPDLFDAPAPAASPALPGVTIRETACRSILNHSGLRDYSFNCYTGCTHACIYCYARFMQRFHPHTEPWGAFVDVKINAADVMAKQVRKLAPGSVFSCSACDGWQSIERHYELTRRCCKLLLDAGFSLHLLTKSDLVLRDLELFKGRDVSVGVTITTPDENHAREWEPGASSVAARLNVLRQAKSLGLRTHIMFGPLLPHISDTPAALQKLFAFAAELKVDRIWTDALNARPRVWPSVQQFLTRRHPQWVEHYRRVLFDEAFRKQYVDTLSARVREAAAHAHVAHRLG